MSSNFVWWKDSENYEIFRLHNLFRQCDVVITRQMLWFDEYEEFFEHYI
jgi:hypothetical protein